VEPREPAPRESGYRAGGRLQHAGRHQTPTAVAALALIVLAGLVFAALDGGSTAPSASDGRLGASPGGSPGRTALSTIPSFATPVPDLAILGQPAPSRLVPMHAGWLRWLDPTSGEYLMEADPPDAGSTYLDFVDAAGSAVEVCVPGPTVGDTVRYEVRLCSPGRGRAPLSIASFDAPLPFLDIEQDRAPFQLDATVSRDGTSLWLATALRAEASWIVEVRAIDIAGWSVRDTRELRRIPVGSAAPAGDAQGGWHVDPDAILKPTIRVTPSGGSLSLTLTATKPFEPDGLLQQERLVFPGSLDPGSPVEIAFPFGGSSDLACDPSRAGWATERHYVTLCSHGEPGGSTQPFVRIENPDDMTRDVAVGPSVPNVPGLFDDSSWLLDGDRGVLYRWAGRGGLTLSTLDVSRRSGATIELLPEGDTPAGGIELLPGGVKADGTVVWMQLSSAGSPEAGLKLAGTGDGRYLYVTALVDPANAPGFPFGPPRTLEWVIDTTTNVLVGRGDAPGPIDQIALGPGGGPLLELVTPGIYGGPEPTTDWDVPLWFVNHRNGEPLEVIGHLHGPGELQPWLLSPTVGTLAGF